MSVEKYSFRKDAEKSLSANFKAKEFQCHDGTDEILISSELVELLQTVRDYFHLPVTINSGYRTVAYNTKIGGAKNSQHLQGKAADIKIEGIPIKALAGYCDEINPRGGVGYYPISLFVHLDSRGVKSRFIETSKGVTASISSFQIDESEWRDYEIKEDQEVIETKSIKIDGKVYTAQMIEKDGFNFLKLQDLKQAGYDVTFQEMVDVQMPTGEIKMSYQGKETTIEGINVNGSIRASLRQALEALNFEVGWESGIVTVAEKRG